MAEAPLRQQQGHRSRVVAPPPSPRGPGDTVPLLQPGKDPVVPASAACAGTGGRYVSRVAVLAWVGFGPAVPAGGATRWEQPHCPAFWEWPHTGHGEPWPLGGISSPGVRGFPRESEPPGLWGAMGRAGGLCHTCWVWATRVCQARAGICHVAGAGLGSASRPREPGQRLLPRLPPAPGAAGRVERVPSGGQGRGDPLPADAQRQLHQGHGR